MRADAEKARVWMREAMNILNTVTVMKRRLRDKEQYAGSGEKNTKQKQTHEEMLEVFLAGNRT